ncbi:hypothetical protein OEZ86_008308 [Tetradesmus obliquus]|nr:hypothetical protein OEZ86_008308 [Tetradesmus obliquus]
MGWSQTVHDNRRRAELQRARDELRKRKRGYDIVSQPDAGMSAVSALLGALAGIAWWRKEGRKLQGRDWGKLPGMQQLLSLVNGSGQTQRSTTRGKTKPKQSAKAAVLKAAASRPAQQQQQQQQQQQRSAPAAAAAAAAVQRQASNNSSSSSSAAKAKKKKSKKKK